MPKIRYYLSRWLYCFPSSSPLLTLIGSTASTPLRGYLSHLVTMMVNRVMMKVNHTTTVKRTTTHSLMK
jgi:hypothetical protein